MSVVSSASAYFTRQAIGGSEEILGKITQELQRRLQQITDNDIRLIQEQAALEERQRDLFGIGLPLQQLEKEIQNVTSFWLSPWALQNLLQYYFEQTCGAEQAYILGDKPQKRLRLSQEARTGVLHDFQQLPRQLSPVFREWEKWLKGSTAYLSITFDAACASEKREMTFLNAIHPLAQQAAQTFQKHEVLYTAFGTSYTLYWLPPEITLDKTPDLYRYVNKELEVDIVEPDNFARKLDTTFLEKQTDEWLVQLYTFLQKQPALNTIVKSKPILRLEDGSHVAPFNRTSSHSRSETPNAYLLREGSSKFPLVKRSLLADETVYTYLKDLGLSEPDIVDEVRTFILPLYKAGVFALVNNERYQQSISYIQEALQRANFHTHQELISLLNKTPFILAINATMMGRGWKTPSEVYYKTEELVTWFEGNEQAWFIAEPFPEALRSDLDIPSQLQPSKRTTMDISGHIVIRNVRADHIRGLYGFDPDAKLDGYGCHLTQ